MFSFIFRLLWRFLIFTLGVSIVWVSVTKIYPYADSRLPAFLVVFLLYCAFAYGIIPLLFRLFRVVIKPNHIPLYVTTGDGWPSDPVNIAIIATSRKHLTRKMNAAGWDTADPLTLKTAIREIASIAFNKEYRKAPLSNLYLFNRPHDIGFEISTNPQGSARTRHHVRFWRLEEPLIQSSHNHHAYTFWFQKLRQFINGEKELWIGAATEETHPIDIQWRTGQLTHGGSHESDKERDFIIQSLTDIRAVAKTHTSESGEQIRFRGQQVRTFYVSDGGIKIVYLK
jgi:hypothetical protein